MQRLYVVPGGSLGAFVVCALKAVETHDTALVKNEFLEWNICIYIYMGSVRFPGPPDLGVW